MTRSRAPRPRAPHLLIAVLVSLGLGWTGPAQAPEGASQPTPAWASARTQVSPRTPLVGAAPRPSGAWSPSPALVVRAAPRFVLRAPVVTVTKPVVKVAKQAPQASTKKPAAPTVYSGTNHFWFPAIGINRKVYSFPCSRSTAPDNYVYRWGCAGANNVYLLGHAYGVFKPLYNAYVSGRLRKGMIAIYADGAGHVHRYRIVSWRVVDPVDSAWAIAAQPVPSMTLQTCVGSTGQDRLNVRLVAID